MIIMSKKHSNYYGLVVIMSKTAGISGRAEKNASNFDQNDENTSGFIASLIKMMKIPKDL